MGRKPRRQPDIVALAKELHTLQSTVARQQELASEVTAALAKSKTALTQTRKALLEAAKSNNAVSAAAVKSPRGPKTTKARKRTKPRPAAYWAARQVALIKAMKKGVLYDSAQLQELVGCANVARHVFAANVRQPLLADKKIKKTIAERGNKSPRNVRWVRS